MDRRVAGFLRDRRRWARRSGWRTTAGTSATLSISIAGRGRRSRSRAKSYYPGRGDWRVAAQYFFEAGQTGRRMAGACCSARRECLLRFDRRAFWPVILLALPPLFYVWSIHSSGTPIFVPTLWPHSLYNTRYAMAFLPLIALGLPAAGAARDPRLANLAAVACSLAFAPVAVRILPTITRSPGRKRTSTRGRAAQWICRGGCVSANRERAHTRRSSPASAI